MKRLFITAALVGSAIALMAIGAGAVPTTVDSTSINIGTNEKILLVVGGDFGTLDDANIANDQLPFGELQGFYTAQSAWFQGLLPGRWMLVSAFRTRAGAAEFEELAWAAGATNLREVVTTYLGTAYIGLGQEPNPDGSGPLDGPLPDGDPNRL